MESLTLTPRPLAEKTAVLGEELWLVTVDLEDAFGALRRPDAWSSVVGRVAGHSVKPRWVGTEGAPIPAGPGCRQVVSESSCFCNAALDDALRDLVARWEALTLAVDLVADPLDRAPLQQGGCGCQHLSHGLRR